MCFRSLLLLPMCLAGLPAEAQHGGDLQAQILYAFQSEDDNELSSLIQTLSTQVQAGGADNALRYDLAHADYRLGLMSAAGPAGNAESAFADCVEQLKPVLEKDGRSAEALALQSACYANLARFRKLEAVLLRSRAAEIGRAHV